jgi:hypothetical protein
MQVNEVASFGACLQAYAALETEVRKTVSGLYGNVCALCTSSCCTPDICEESQDSAFLRKLRGEHNPDALFCDRFGWLTEQGCGLCVARPPVCYGFFCNEIVDALSDREKAIIRVLGRLLSWVGERATGSTHLVEIIRDDELGSLNTNRLISRIGVAQDALAGVRAALESAPLEQDWLLAMQQISRSAEFDA